MVNFFLLQLNLLGSIRNSARMILLLSISKSDLGKVRRAMLIKLMMSSLAASDLFLVCSNSSSTTAYKLGVTKIDTETYRKFT